MRRKHFLILRKRGFAFIEVLVAFALLSVVMGLVFQNTTRTSKLLTKAEKTSVAYAYAHSQLDKMLAARNFENGDFVVSGEGIFRAELSVSSVTSLMQKGRYANSSFWQIQIKVYDKEIRNTRLPLVVLEQLVTLDRLSND